MRLSGSSRLLGARWLWVSVLIGMLALALAVQSAPASASAKKSASLTTIKLLSPGRAASVAPFAIGRSLGFFKREGIDLQINYNIPPSQITSNLLAGNADIGATSWGTVVSVVSNGVSLVGIKGFTRGGSTSANDEAQLVTLASSSIKTLNDLRGKTIAVGTLGAQLDIETRYMLFKKVGLLAKDFNVVQVPFTDMGAALRAGRIDAFTAIEPFMAQTSLLAPLRKLAGINYAVAPNLPGSMFDTTLAYYNSHKALIAAFRRAVDTCLRWVQRNTTKFRSMLPDFLKIDKAVVDKMAMPAFSSVVDTKLLTRYITIANNLGKLGRKPVPAEFVRLR